MKSRATVLLALSFAAAAPAVRAGEPALLPLPEAPVRLVIPDAAAFDAALAGSFRKAATGDLDPNDPLVSAWRQSQVGSKLEAEWSKLAGDLPWTWAEVRRLQPRSLGVALLSVGSLEAVLAIDTPLAALPLTPPAGTAKTHAGIAYSLVSRGAGDAVGRDERRMGLAWARHHGILLLATSEKALEAALDLAAAGKGTGAFLPGLASLELDLDTLRKDRYFAREFVFGTPADRGRVRAALRLESGRIVEVREGSGPAAPAALAFDAGAAAAAGWEPEGERFFDALRAGVLEPQPSLPDKPRPALAPLPATATEAADRYMVRLDRPKTDAAAPWEEGDLATWRALLAARPAAGWAWWADAQGERAVGFAWPAAKQAELERACRETLARRAGTVTSATVGDATELRVGPALPALGLRRAGDLVWLGTSARAVAALPAPKPAGDVVRWARVDLAAVRALAPSWARVEGPAAPERVRTFSDRVLGLLGWIPSVKAISVERKQAASGWTERVVFESAAP
ncbi:MAG: hypothetical protein U0599_07315 [Vicinamibacteria bacterium]